MFRVKLEEKHAPKPFSNKPIAKGNHLQQKKTIVKVVCAKAEHTC